MRTLVLTSSHYGNSSSVFSEENSSSRSSALGSAHYDGVQSSSTSASQDAVKISFTRNNEVGNTAETFAQTTMANLNAYLRTAESSVRDVSQLIQNLKTLAIRFRDNLLTPSEKALLVSTADSFLSEVTDIAGNSKSSDTKVIDNGPTEFNYDLDGSKNNSDSTYGVVIPTIESSRSDLQLSAVSGSSLASSPTATLDQLTDAKRTTGQNLAMVQNVISSLESFVQQRGNAVRNIDLADKTPSTASAAELHHTISEFLGSGFAELKSNPNSRVTQQIIKHYETSRAQDLTSRRDRASRDGVVAAYLSI